MKNLKRVLSLGLASVMLLGMMVVGASAVDFTDAEDIVHDEAVKILVALKVVNGKEDGSFFDPKGDVTRGEMAKMIATIKLGGSNVNTGVKTVPSFTDIGGHWAEPYIEYCADMGIISGRGDGTFDPNGKVTNLEATKMVLTTLGYEAKAYHLEGATWASQTDELARSTCDPQLYKDLEGNLVMNEPATRDTAAQILWNGLQNETRTINPEKNTNNLEVTWGYGGSGKTLLKERYDGDIMLGTYQGNYDYNPGGALKGEINVSGEHFPSDLSIDNIGEEVRVIWKDGDKGTDGKPDNKDTIFGVFNTGATRVVKSQLSKVKDNKNSKEILNIDGTKYDAESTVDVIVNYSDDVKTLSSAGKDASSGKEDNSALTKFLKKNSGNKIKVIFDDTTGKVETVYLTETYVAAVTGVNSTTVTLNNGGNALKIEDHNIEEGLKKGDVVLWTCFYGDKPDDTSSGVVTVTKAEKVSGEVTGYKNTKIDDEDPSAENFDDSVTVDGKTYKFNYQNGGQSSSASSNSKNGLLTTIPDVEGDVVAKFAKSQDSHIGEDVDLYLSNGYVVAAVQTSETSNNYSVVTEVKSATAGSVFSALQLQVMGADGTKEIITVSDDDINDINGDKEVDEKDFSVGDIVTYTFDKDDEAEVKVRDEAKVQRVSYNAKSKTVNGKATSADCVFFAQTKTGLTLTADSTILAGADWEAYDIRSLDTASWTTKVASVVIKDDKVVAVFVDVANTPEGAKDDTVYGVVADYTGRVEGYYTYLIQANGEEYSVSYKSNALQKGDLVSFRPTADDKYNTGKINEIKASEPDYSVAYVKEYSSRDNTLTFFDATEDKDSDGAYEGKGTAKTYALDADCKIIYVDQSSQKSLGEGSIDEFNSVENQPNVAFITKLVDGDAVIDVLFVETSGKEHVNYRNK